MKRKGVHVQYVPIRKARVDSGLVCLRVFSPNSHVHYLTPIELKNTKQVVQDLHGIYGAWEDAIQLFTGRVVNRNLVSKATFAASYEIFS